MNILAKKIIGRLDKLKWKLATMESCTSGNVINTITNQEGASKITEGGFVTYSNESKIRMGVPEEVIRKSGVYSIQTAIEMAKAAKEANNCEIGIGVTGTFNNIDNNNPDSLALTAFYAIAVGKGKFYVDKLAVPLGERQHQKDYVTKSILENLDEILALELSMKK